MLETKDDWNQKWDGIFEQYQQDLRNAYYVHAVLNKNEKNLLELGAGSFRDTAELNRRGFCCHGIDFSDESIKRAKEKHPVYSHLMHEMDVLNLNFSDKTFDLSFQNGLIVLLDEEQIDISLKEQARVTKKRMIVTVHNAHNENFKAYFEEKKKTDPLYDIRFFYKDEMEKLMKKHCVDVTIIPVGKAKKSYEDFLIKIGLGHPMLLRFLFKISGHRLIHKSERLMCIGTLAE